MAAETMRLSSHSVREIKEIEVAKARADEDRKREIIEASNLLTTFLDPNSASGSQLQAPDYIWKAILELSQFLQDQDVQFGSVQKQSMGDLLVRAERKMRNAKSGNLSFRTAFPVEAFKL